MPQPEAAAHLIEARHGLCTRTTLHRLRFVSIVVALSLIFCVNVGIAMGLPSVFRLLVPRRNQSRFIILRVLTLQR